MITISVCMIVKNEEKILARCLDSLTGIADELIVADTGSTDGTKEIAARYGAKLFDFPWDGDFSAARNFVFSKATADYVYSADADEVLDEENRRRFLHLKQTLPPDIELVQMRYSSRLQFNTAYNFDEEPRPKLFRRLRTFRWADPVHETVELTPRVLDSGIVIRHLPQSLHSPRDFAILRHAAERSPLSARLLRMYAMELFISGTDADFADALPVFEPVLHDESRSLGEVRAAQCVVVRAARLKRDTETMFKNALKNVISEPCAEVCCDLGDYFRSREDWEEAATWYYTAANGAQSELDLRASGETPLPRLAECYEKLGLPAEAEACRRKAGQEPSFFSENRNGS